MQSKFLDGKKIYLRGIEKSDVNESYQQWFNDEEVCRFNSHHRFPKRREDMESYYQNVICSDNNLVLAIFSKKTKEHIGNVSLQSINFFERSAEFAIIIGDKKYWGEGVGKEAGQIIIDHGFQELNLHRIYCGTSEDNIGMQKLAVHLGFQKEGISRKAMYKNGKYRDIIHYGLLAT